MYGLYPRKGTIAIGSDADLVIWDARNFRLSNDDLHHACDYSPYEGMTLNAWPAMTLLRGEVVWDGKTFSGHAGAGEFVVRGLPSIPRISARAETPTDWRTACQVS
jgi:dihydropyrimidinase